MGSVFWLDRWRGVAGYGWRRMLDWLRADDGPVSAQNLDQRHEGGGEDAPHRQGRGGGGASGGGAGDGALSGGERNGGGTLRRAQARQHRGGGAAADGGGVVGAGAEVAGSLGEHVAEEGHAVARDGVALHHLDHVVEEDIGLDGDGDEEVRPAARVLRPADVVHLLVLHGLDTAQAGEEVLPELIARRHRHRLGQALVGAGVVGDEEVVRVLGPRRHLGRVGAQAGEGVSVERLEARGGHEVAMLRRLGGALGEVESAVGGEVSRDPDGRLLGGEQARLGPLAGADPVVAGGGDELVDGGLAVVEGRHELAPLGVGLPGELGVGADDDRIGPGYLVERIGEGHVELGRQQGASSWSSRVQEETRRIVLSSREVFGLLGIDSLIKAGACCVKTINSDYARSFSNDLDPLQERRGPDVGFRDRHGNRCISRHVGRGWTATLVQDVGGRRIRLEIL
mmetsp:Transcript_33554/g.70352  ORF Transcript_33554/g.70352 Transcript_33554/m.70352 type:complete len:454 (+) Transcript_33554:168-1529(+)